MKKIFTLVAAALTTLAAGAVSHNTVSLSNVKANAQLNQEFNTVMAPEFMSRAGEVAELKAGSYNVSMFDIVVDDAGQIIGQFLENAGSLVIAKDPDSENGYLVKRFLDDWWNAGSSQTTTFNDLKATWDADKQTLSILPNQALFSFTEDNGEKWDVYVVCFNQQGKADENLALELSMDYGRFVVSSKIMGFMLGNFTLDRGFAYQFGDMNIFMPNGTMSGAVSSSSGTQDLEWDVYTIWTGGGFYVYGFGMLEAILPCGLYYDKAAQEAIFHSDGRTGSPFSSYYLNWFPSVDPSANLDSYVYACELDPETMEPLGSDFYLAGVVNSATDEKVEVEFPAYGMFTADDAIAMMFQDVKLSFAPNAIAGIENVEAAESTDAPVVYYNLQGMRVMNPSNGIFIRQQGNVTSKVLVK
nr:hypothetical protein [Bacteroides sp.]